MQRAVKWQYLWQIQQAIAVKRLFGTHNEEKAIKCSRQITSYNTLSSNHSNYISHNSPAVIERKRRADRPSSPESPSRDLRSGVDEGRLTAYSRGRGSGPCPSFRPCLASQVENAVFLQSLAVSSRFVVQPPDFAKVTSTGVRLSHSSQQVRIKYSLQNCTAFAPRPLQPDGISVVAFPHVFCSCLAALADRGPSSSDLGGVGCRRSLVQAALAALAAASFP